MSTYGIKVLEAQIKKHQIEIEKINNIDHELQASVMFSDNELEEHNRCIEDLQEDIKLFTNVSQRSELLAFKRFISKTPLAELELYSDEEFTDLYIKANCG